MSHAGSHGLHSRLDDQKPLKGSKQEVHSLIDMAYFFFFQFSQSILAGWGGETHVGSQFFLT